MKQEDVEYVKNIIDNEGFDYGFMSYSSFKKIDDEKFHELRKNYMAAYGDLNNYINEQLND